MAKKFFGAVFADGTKITRASNGRFDFTHAYKVSGPYGWKPGVWTHTGFGSSYASAAKGGSVGNKDAVLEIVPALVFATAKDMKAWKGAS